jgi:Single-stranded DNA-specific exonuclease
MSPVPALAERADACARRLRSAEAVMVASHIDADGLTSAAIAATALERAGIPHKVIFENQLDDDRIAAIAATDYQTVLFTDFGSGQLDAIAEHERAGAFEPVIADHHQPADAMTQYHLNPLLEGLDGASELSGAGASYVLARSLAAEADTDGHSNRDLAALAVVGAIGDMQAVDGELVGANRGIVEEATDAGVLAERTDLALYGTQTRPLPKLLEYASEVHIPGVSNDEAGAIRFLEDLGVGLKQGDQWRRWVDLSADEKQTVASALLQRALKRGVPAERAQRLVGTTYILEDKQAGTPLRDASEFSTLLNATARYDRADVGLAVCLDARSGAIERAQSLLQNHRRRLSEGIDHVEKRGVTTADNLQWFDAGDEIRETIVGIVAGMALGTDGADATRPIIAFAQKTDDETKVSGRGTDRLVGDGLDLATVMREAAQAVGGDGGGHDIAAGATIPTGQEQTFITHADTLVGEQLG